MKNCARGRTLLQMLDLSQLIETSIASPAMAVKEATLWTAALKARRRTLCAGCGRTVKCLPVPA